MQTSAAIAGNQSILFQAQQQQMQPTQSQLTYPIALNN